MHLVKVLVLCQSLGHNEKDRVFEHTSGHIFNRLEYLCFKSVTGEYINTLSLAYNK